MNHDNLLQTLLINLEAKKNEIFEANKLDVSNAIKLEKDSAFIERLTVSQKTFEGMVASLNSIIAQESPIGKVLEEWIVPHNGLKIQRISCPIGRILIIYESRPNVTLDAFALCFKSGNKCILRGGSESVLTSSKIVEIIHATFDDLGFEAMKHDFVQYVENSDRSHLVSILKKNDEIDLVIPRGGKGLIKFISENTTIPVLKHLDGNCHTYIENSANPKMAIEVLINAKMRRVSVCGATETVVLDEEFAKNHLPNIVDSMPACEFVGCMESIRIDRRIKIASDEDFYTEFLAAKIAVKIVQNVGEAVNFINKYSSKHTEAILSENTDAVAKFKKEIQSAIVIHNGSTQFADGFEFGFGGEIGISTGKLHARGPVALRELTTYKSFVQPADGGYKVRG
jgi:glutamate-5-semialdehyde dehydrogenase